MKAKHSLTIFLLIGSYCAYSQSGEIKVNIHLTDSASVVSFVELITRDTQVIAEGRAPDTLFNFHKLQAGNYMIALYSREGKPVFRNIILRENQSINITIPFPAPCPYRYAKGFSPKCPYGHRDNVIPIVYGLPGKKLLEDAEKGLVQLGGCEVSDCDPKYYCKIHKIEF